MIGRLFRKLSTLREESEKVIVFTEAVKENAERDHEAALARLEKAEEQARTLSGMDRRNHYSESLTKAFQGRTA